MSPEETISEEHNRKPGPEEANLERSLPPRSSRLPATAIRASGVCRYAETRMPAAPKISSAPRPISDPRLRLERLPAPTASHSLDLLPLDHPPRQVLAASSSSRHVPYRFPRLPEPPCRSHQPPRRPPSASRSLQAPSAERRHWIAFIGPTVSPRRSDWLLR